MRAHTTSESSTQDGEPWWSDARLKPVRVVVCTSSCTAIGHTYRQHHQRLLDALNKGLVANSALIGKNFLPLTDAKVFFLGGEQEYLAYTHIRKASILFVAEISGGQPETVGYQGSLWSATRGAEKAMTKPVAAKVRMPSYSLVGKMHVGIWEQLVHTLEGEERFSALTDVEIAPQLVNGESRFDFVAINKDQVVSVGESAGATPKLALAEGKTREDTNKGLRTYVAAKLYSVDRWLEKVETQIASRLPEAERERIERQKARRLEAQRQKVERQELEKLKAQRGKAERQNLDRPKERKRKPMNGQCPKCRYPVSQSLKWGTRSQKGTLVCRACREPLFRP